MLSDLDIMGRHARALFTHDDRGRLRRVNEPDGAEAPRFFLGRTAAGHLWRYRFDLPQSLAGQLEAVCVGEPIADELGHEPAYSAEYLRLLETHAPVQKVWTGPTYLFPDSVARPSREAVVVTSENADVLRGGFEDWIADVPRSRPFVALLHEGQAVSVCCSVRVTSEAQEAGVETLAAYRGKGYAADVAARWAEEVRKIGCTPLYSTSWENVASQRVAQRLGLRQFGVTFHVS